MVRITDQRIIAGDKVLIEAFGLSTDSKPTANLATGSVFVTVDTADAYFFDEVSGQWKKAGDSNG